MAKHYTEDDLLQMIREMVAGSTITGVAETLGFTKQYMADIVAGKVGVSENVAAALGYKREVIYRKNQAA